MLVETRETGAEQYKRAPPRARRFIDLIGGGMTQRKAHGEAGYTGKSENAPSVLGLKWALAIDFKKEQVATDMEAARRRSFARIEHYAEGSLDDVLTEDAELDWKNLKKAQRRLVSKMKIKTSTFRVKGEIDTTETVRTVELELEPRMAAEQQLAKHGGWHQAKKVEVELGVGEKSIEALKNVNASAAEKLVSALDKIRSK